MKRIGLPDSTLQPGTILVGAPAQGVQSVSIYTLKLTNAHLIESRNICTNTPVASSIATKSVPRVMMIARFLPHMAHVRSIRMAREGETCQSYCGGAIHSVPAA
jgi:hypothetical protein